MLATGMSGICSGIPCRKFANVWQIFNIFANIWQNTFRARQRVLPMFGKPPGNCRTLAKRRSTVGLDALEPRQACEITEMLRVFGQLPCVEQRPDDQTVLRLRLLLFRIFGHSSVLPFQ
jgi:hypothetical protein